MKHSLINIQSVVKNSFDIVIPNSILKKYHDEILKTNMYKLNITTLVQEILNLYKPNEETYIVDYSNNCFYSIMCAKQKFNVIYNNSLQKYNKFIELSKIINRVEFININSKFKINNYIKTKFVPLLILTNPKYITNSKRPLNSYKIHNIIIIRDDDNSNDIKEYKVLLEKNYIFYKIDVLLTKINKLHEFLKEDKYSSIIAVAPNSKYSNIETVYFD